MRFISFQPSEIDVIANQNPPHTIILPFKNPDSYF